MRRTTAVRPPSAVSLRRATSAGSALSSNASESTEQMDEDGHDQVPMEASMTCVAVVEEGSQIAFACYSEDRNDIILEQSYANGHDTEEVVEQFLAVARPNLILVGNKIVANANLLYVLTRPPPQIPDEATNDAQQPSTPNQKQGGATPYRLLKSSAFDVRRCRAMILEKLRVLTLLRRQQAPRAHGAIDASHDRQFPNFNGSNQQVFGASTYHSLASVVDFDSSVQVRALGSLISFLNSTLFRLEEDGTVTINAIHQAKTCMFMRINTAAMRALHIFATEHHPLMAKGHGHTKEGFSLFSLLDRTKSKVGRQNAAGMDAQALFDRQAISQRQDGVELFLRDRVPRIGRRAAQLAGKGRRCRQDSRANAKVQCRSHGLCSALADTVGCTSHIRPLVQ